MIQLEHTEEEGTHVIAVPTMGILAFDRQVMAAIENEIRVLLESGARQPRVAVDVSNACYADSEALGKFIDISKKLHMAKGGLRIYGPQKILSEILESTGLTQVLSVYPDKSTALDSPWK